MAIRRKNFSTKKAGTDDIVMLDLNEETSFKCASKIPGMVLVDFIAEMDEDDPKSMGDGLKTFLESALDESYEAFLTYVRDPKNDVSLEDIAEMAGWLAEQYTGGNPTVPSPPSSDGSMPSGLGSEAAPYVTA